MNHPDEPRALGQLDRARSARWPFVLLAALVGAAGCDPGPGPADGGPRDADAVEDAGPRADAGDDAGTTADAGPPPPTRCVSPEAADPSGTDALDDPSGRATVTIDDRAACARAYTLATTAPLRDGRPDNPRVVLEEAGAPTLRSGHDLFDALYALALEEARECSVSAVRDGAFNDGGAVSCGDGGCFETGRLWNYVWTRDTAYAMHLGLAELDPARARNSLEFKLSERRGGGDLQIVQDTGTGGSYPISSDRVAWALGAEALLAQLEGADRDAFAARAYEALRNTAEHDRRVVYDAPRGLYLGEQSFLDWREQTYPDWVRGDVVHIGMSAALGTNLLHLRALELTARLAGEAGDETARARYQGWADGLRDAIRAAFWLEEEGLFATYTTTALDPAPVRRFDLLASAFAVLFGVATEAQADRVLASYPHYGPGAPVAWPQQQDTPIYHNRGEWPFVTAYWLRAARHADNPTVASRMVRALVRGAAINLSNMENFEAASGAPWVDDGPASGPVVNSQRQLWSVAGYLSMVHHAIFGLEAEQDALRVAPYLPGELADALFGGTDAIVLNEYPFRGRRVTIVLRLPDARTGGALAVGRVTLNGVEVTDGRLPVEQLLDDNRVEVTLEAGPASAATITERDPAEWRQIFGPRTPTITTRAVGGRVELTLSTPEAADVTWRIYRDGLMVADGLPGTTTAWTDPDVDATGPRSPCYTAETTFTVSGNHSQHASPACWWGPGAARITTIDASAMTHVGGAASTDHGRFHYEPWGEPGDRLEVPSFTATQDGPHLFQVTFGNGAGSENTGVTCGVKRLVVEEVASGAVVGEGPLMMPHLGTWSRWEDSSFVTADLRAGVAYRVVIRGDDEMVNMSAFAHFEDYTGGLGGRSGAFNRVNIAELKILAR